MKSKNENQPGGEIFLYQTEDGKTRLEVQFQGDTVWLSQAQMSELFQTTKQNVSLHIQNIYDERELERTGTVKESLTWLTAVSGSTAQQVICIRDIRPLPLPLPPLVEQKRIVAEVDRRLSLIRKTENQANANLQRTQVLRQSVLSKAFADPPIDS